MTLVGFLFTLARLALPVIITWIQEAQRAGIVTEGEQKLLGKQALGLAKELGAWDDSQITVRNKSDADLDDLLSGRVRENKSRGTPGQSGPQSNL